MNDIQEKRRSLEIKMSIDGAQIHLSGPPMTQQGNKNLKVLFDRMKVCYNDLRGIDHPKQAMDAARKVLDEISRRGVCDDLKPQVEEAIRLLKPDENPDATL